MAYDDNEIDHADDEKSKHGIQQVADVQTAVVQHANDEESDDEHVCHGAAQAIAAQVVGRAFDVDNRKRDCKRNRSITVLC